MSLKLRIILGNLWKNFIRGISVDNTAQELLSLDYYEFPEVCLATIKFWFNVFIEDELQNRQFSLINNARFRQHKDFLLQLLAENPTWTTAHYMDALKENDQIIRNYITKLGYIYYYGIWCKPQ
ncbi:hypothetical protein M0804_013704 [Polistes exclamans]|nr:hypothetical protein M0804_013704 [Polistes exclamans]